jgi:hypothetical protein
MKATLVDINTCDCLPGFYYEPKSNTCESCNILCRECTGPSNNECKGCLNSYSVQYRETLCVYSCEQLSAYYRENDACLSNS